MSVYNSEIKQLKQLSDELYDQIYEVATSGLNLIDLVEKNIENINEIFNCFSRLEPLSEEELEKMIDMGLEINQVFSGVDGEWDNCTFAVHCAEFRQLESIQVMLRKGLILPTKENISHANDLIEPLICGHSYGDFDERVFVFILDNLADHPIVISEICNEMISEFYTDLVYEYRKSLTLFLLKALKDKDIKYIDNNYH